MSFGLADMGLIGMGADVKTQISHRPSHGLWAYRHGTDMGADVKTQISHRLPHGLWAYRHGLGMGQTWV